MQQRVHLNMVSLAPFQLCHPFNCCHVLNQMKQDARGNQGCLLIHRLMSTGDFFIHREREREKAMDHSHQLQIFPKWRSSAWATLSWNSSAVREERVGLSTKAAHSSILVMCGIHVRRKRKMDGSTDSG